MEPDVLVERTRLELTTWHRGHSRAVHKARLAAKVGASERQVKIAVNALRIEGVPVASGNDGYYLATTPEELDGTLNRIKSQAFVMLGTVKGLRKAHRNLGEQNHGRNTHHQSTGGKLQAVEGGLHRTKTGWLFGDGGREQRAW